MRALLISLLALLLSACDGGLWNNPYPSFGIPLQFQVVLGLGGLSALLTVGVLVYMVLACVARLPRGTDTRRPGHPNRS